MVSKEDLSCILLTLVKEKSDITEGVGAVNLQLLESLLEGQLLGSTRTHLERRKDSLWI
jgi:hypothetical protein